MPLFKSKPKENCGQNEKWSKTLTQAQFLEIVTYTLYLMGEDSVQPVLNLFFGGDPPRTMMEYRAAESHVAALTNRCLPNYNDQSADREVALKVIDPCPIAPTDLMSHWASLGVLYYAMGNYDMCCECAAAIQEIAMQFCDDRVLVLGSMLSFALSIFCLKTKQHPTSYPLQTMITLSRHVQTKLLDDKKHKSARVHSIEARRQALLFVLLTIDLWRSIYKLDWGLNNILTEKVNAQILQHCSEIDRRTNDILEVENWYKTAFLPVFD